MSLPVSLGEGPAGAFDSVRSSIEKNGFTFLLHCVQVYFYCAYSIITQSNSLLEGDEHEKVGNTQRTNTQITEHKSGNRKRDRPDMPSLPLCLLV